MIKLFLAGQEADLRRTVRTAQIRRKKDFTLRGEAADREEEELKKFRLLNDLLKGKLSEEEADKRAMDLGVQLGEGVYRFLIFKAWRRSEEEGTEEQLDEIGKRLQNCLESIFKETVLGYRNGEERWLLLLHANSQEDMKEKTSDLKQVLEKVMKEYPLLEFFGGIGECALKISDLKSAFETAEKAFSRRFIEEFGQILIEEDFDDIQNKTFTPDNLDKLEYSRLLIEKFLIKGEMEDVDSFINFYFNEIPEDNFRSLLMRQYLSVDIFMVINSFYKKNGFDRKPEEYSEAFAERIQNANTVEQMRKVFRDVLVDTLKRRDEISGNKYTFLIETAGAYIEKNYMSEDISLNSVAEHVNMNPSYFSTVFRKETGKTFVEYLTRVRLERAKELLLCSSLKISEIAYKVGYNDPQYFSYLFKKYNQCSPKEYRQRGKT